MFIFATYIAVRRDTVSKDVLGYTIAPTELAYNWQELLDELKDRGVEDVLLFISDGLKGMVDTIQSIFPKAQHQICLVHVARYISHKVHVEDRQAVCNESILHTSEF